jgi:uncharacterized protein YggE
MSPKIKDVFGWVAVAGIVVLAIGGLQYTSAYSRSVPPSASFSVTGNGRVVAVPDVAQFSFGITTEGGKDIGALQNDNTTKTNTAIDYVKSQGVDAKDIETQNYAISPRYQSFSCPPVIYNQISGNAVSPLQPKPCPPSEIVGYTINQTISVKVRDFSKIGNILSGVASSGANNVSDLNFTLNDRTLSENDARGKAITQAQSKASDLAVAGHFTLGRILSIQEGSNPAPIMYNGTYSPGVAALDVKAVAPSIEPGSQEITSQVTITYEID